jgi:hypothetical protein
MPEIILNYTYTVKCERIVAVPEDWDQSNLTELAFNGDYDSDNRDESERYYDDPLFEVDSHGVENLAWRKA